MIRNKKLFLLDMDGTLYLDMNLIPGAKEFLDYLKEHNIDYLYITNNSSKSVDSYVNKMNQLGIESTEKEYFTSTEATIVYLKERNIHSIFLLGTKSLEEEMKKHFKVFMAGTNHKVDCVVLGFDRELTYQKLEDACYYLKNKEVLFVATNPDLRCPMGKDEYIPDCGSMAKLLEDATERRPVFIGKPNPYMIDCILKKKNLKKEDLIMIGDRVYTDILGAVNSQIDSIALLSGETTLEEIHKQEYKPTYIMNSIMDVYQILKENKEI